MNGLGISCFNNGMGITVLYDSSLISYVFKSPKIYGKEEINLVLDNQRNNLVSLVQEYRIDTIALKQAENVSFGSRNGLTDGQRNQLYLEGMVFSFAGYLNLNCRFLQKNSIKRILGKNVDKIDIFEKFYKEHRICIEKVDKEDANIHKASLVLLCALVETVAQEFKLVNIEPYANNGYLI
jgi:hypothetical protein